ncbi:rho GTPase-activating protein 18 [Pseudonaja textilis]|uniref:Rho GTPase-activating protein 18 n=1 Tax=Pseudonaja textilis TaxID=8673 RepID=A0A670YQ97_PSETE|nr:rho GTPase-activating protein 18 [Pseudonaja textilis]
MSRWSASQGVVLTAYHPSSGSRRRRSLQDAQEAPGANAEENAEASPLSRRSGQYTMNHDNSKKPSGKLPCEHSGSQDSLDELSMDDYWKELENIHETRSGDHEERDLVVVKEPDEGELEEEWLKEAGLSTLFGEAAADSHESMVVLATLTRTQAIAVQKRVDTVTQTMRKKNKQYQVPDVREIFKQQNESMEKESSIDHQPVRAEGKKESSQKDAKEAYGQHIDTCPREDLQPAETDINLEISFSEQAVNLKNNSESDLLKDKEDDALLPNFRFPKDKTGTTKIGDLAPQDMKKIHALALIELSALFDILGIELKPQKAAKIKAKESGLFGVPLLVLLEHDQKRIPGIRTPLIFQKLISQIEGGKLETEGLLRIPGVVARVKNLCQELESKFYEGTFNWDSVKQHDAASLLKFFIRELPQPLFTVEYLKAFQDVQKLPTKKHQLQALNLLVLLLPEGNRDTLKVLLEFLQRVIDHRDKNKMNLKNVAMVMAPNLFVFHGLGAKPTEQSEFIMAAGTANVMRFMIKYQNLIWTIPTFLVNQVRKQNAESQKKERKDKAMRKLLKKMAYDREKHEKQDKSISDQKSGNDADIPEGVIRVQAPHLSKVSMAIQLTGELKAGDIIARFLSQKSGTIQGLKKEELFLHEVGGNIGERCLDDDTFMKDLYQLNPNAEWIIKSKNG